MFWGTSEMHSFQIISLNWQLVWRWCLLFLHLIAFLYMLFDGNMSEFRESREIFNLLSGLYMSKKCNLFITVLTKNINTHIKACDIHNSLLRHRMNFKRHPWWLSVIHVTSLNRKQSKTFVFLLKNVRYFILYYPKTSQPLLRIILYVYIILFYIYTHPFSPLELWIWCMMFHIKRAEFSM